MKPSEIPGPTTDIHSKPLDFGTPGNVKPAGGHCCKCLMLFWTFYDLNASYNSAKAGGTTFKREDGTVVENILDVLTIAPMLRLVGVVNENPLSGGAGCEPRKVWRCIHCNETNDFKCDIYDRRPMMCRAYPGQSLGNEDGRCQYPYCQSVDCPGFRK